MKNKKPLLSICIPTYNREKYLEECINSIINQEGYNKEEIEIIVSDNASIDNTENIVKKYKNIKYYKNKKNIGMVKNVTKILDYANGKYSWVISDDDCLFENILNNIIKFLKNNSINIIVLNYSNYDNKLNRVTLENVMQIDKDIRLLDTNVFINYIIKNWDKIIGGLFFYISNKIFLTEIFNSNKMKKVILDSDIKNEYKYAFPFSMILIKEFINSGCYIMSKKYIKLRNGNLSWDYNELIIYKYYLYKHIYNNTNEKSLKKHIKVSIKKLIFSKLMFLYSLKLITKKLGIYIFISKLWVKYFLRK